ncbi:MAG: adenylosuccinate lyase [Candidatus Ancillula sp.]|jgi:adenylosuccinate lyase|nr:adenylosuccinate lyase [Candidatus Ancillula sp.]
MTRVDFTKINDFIALTPIDGRYRRYTASLVNFLSEAALNRERVWVESNWVVALSEKQAVPGIPELTSKQKEFFLSLADKFDEESIKWLSEKEKETQHDVKAIEYYIDFEIDKSSLFSEEEARRLKLSVHFCCTSEDINNLSYALCVKRAVEECWLPKGQEFIANLTKIAQDNIDIPMLAKTHGQPATPTTLGKEIAVFVWRLKRQVKLIENQEYLGKINGATGTFGAHTVAVPGFNWPEFAKFFVEEKLGLTYNPLTTQIESHDWQVELYDRAAHFGRILHNFATDIWTYISNEVFGQIPVAGATGSSTMPHKINPIKFENAEANLEISDALFSKLSETLATARMQRDLTDSTTQRNIGVAFAHSLLAICNLNDGISRLYVHKDNLSAELDRNPAVLSEAIQTVMRAAGIAGVPGMDDPYKKLKDLTRGHDEITMESLREFVKKQNLPKETEERLLALTPATYIGIAPELGKLAL